MDLSPIGAAALIAREGRRLKAYRDSVGIWTIGIGHTSMAGPPRVTPGLTITAAECDALFARDVETYVKPVRDALAAHMEAHMDASMAVPLPQHAFDALVSLCFNIGPTAFLRSSVLRRLRAGDREGAAEAILMWNRPREVIPRRQGEYDQFRTPYGVALPRARRGDAGPVARPSKRLAEAQAAAPSAEPPKATAEGPAQGSPRGDARPSSTQVPTSPRRLARLWDYLRGRLRA